MGALNATPGDRVLRAPVNVRAMLDLARAVAERDGLQGDARDYARAGDALDALIDACRRATCQCPGGAWRTAALPYGKHQHDCHLGGIPAALARVGGAA
jgi:hypothetical protein